VSTTVRVVTTQPPPAGGGDPGEGEGGPPGALFRPARIPSGQYPWGQFVLGGFPPPRSSSEGAPPDHGTSPPHSAEPRHDSAHGFDTTDGHGRIKPGTDGFAIAAVLSSIVGGVPVSVVLGIMALARVRRSGRRGRGLAIAALVISGLWVVAVGALVAGAAANSAQRDSRGAVTKAGRISAADLRKGDCLRTAPNDDEGVGSVDVTPCAFPHRAQVYAVFDLPDEPYPGDSRVLQLADEGCQDRTPDISGADANTLAALYLYPEQAQWESGKRSVRCILASRTDLHTTLLR
jgi:hypothetical protein